MCGIYARYRSPYLRACELTSIYSPAHALWWAAAGTLNLGAFGAWVAVPALMAAFSLQAYFFATEYAAYVKDRSTLAAEMLHEYDEKVRVC